MASKENGCKNPPSKTSNSETIKEFATKCAKTRTAYPSICALDFEHVIKITTKHLLGWDETHHQNIANTGLFGDLDAYAYAVEEQGKKSLHAHFLIWLKKWNKVLDGLGELHLREHCTNVLKNHSFMTKSDISMEKKT